MITDNFNKGFMKVAFNAKTLLNTIPRANHGKGMLDMGREQARKALSTAPVIKKPLQQFRNSVPKTPIAPERGTLK